VNAVLELLAHAETFRGTAEIPPHLNRGPEIDDWNTRVGNPLRSPWCAAFAWCMGNDVFKGRWPVVRSGGCQDIYRWAQRLRLLTVTPAPGDLGLLYHAELRRYAHVFYVKAGPHASTAGGATIETIEGNTNTDGSREGWGVFVRTRFVTPRLAFVRWAPLLEVA
jgi:hypothetical protein